MIVIITRLFVINVTALKTHIDFAVITGITDITGSIFNIAKNAVIEIIVKTVNSAIFNINSIFAVIAMTIILSITVIKTFIYIIGDIVNIANYSLQTKSINF